MSALLDSVDVLYRGVVSEPGEWNDQRFEDWANSLGESSALDKASSKYVRRVMTSARKLRTFWLSQPGSQEDDWRSRVDLALGNRAWRPVLDLSMHELEKDPSYELFERTSDLFRSVNHEPYLDGIGFDAFLETRPRAD
ncbi:MAG: hypothetical protein ACC654_08255 [Acidimicrobiia bacterium]